MNIENIKAEIKEKLKTAQNSDEIRIRHYHSFLQR